MNSMLKVGVVEEELPMVTECSRQMDSWESEYLRKHKCNPGIAVELFALIARHLKLQYDILPLTTGHEYGKIVGLNETTGKPLFNGYLAYIQNGSVDMVLGPYSMFDDRKDNFHFAPAVIPSQWGIMASTVKPRSQLDEAATLMHPFDGYTWMLMLIMGMTFSLMFRVYSHILIHQNSKLLTIVFAIASLHAVNMYKGALLASYLVQSRRSTVSNVEQMVEHVEAGEVKLMLTNQNFSTLTMIENSDSLLTKRLTKALRKNPPIFYHDNISLALELLQSHKAIRLDNAEYVFWPAMAKKCFLRSIRINDLNWYSSPEPRPLAFAVMSREHVQLGHLISQTIDNMDLTSAMSRIQQTYDVQVENNQYMCTIKNQSNGPLLPHVTLSQIAGLVGLYASTILASILVLFYECFRPSVYY